MPIPEIDLTVYPDECDAFGHLNQASCLSLFERARWDMLAAGPGMDVFTRAGVWPAARKTTVDYHASAFPGDVLRFHTTLTHHGRTSFTLRQTAHRVRDDQLIASAEFVFVCINRQGRPTPVPEEVGRYLNQPAARQVGVRRLTVNGVSLAVDARGEPGQPAVLFIHGYPLDRTIWSHQMGALDRWHRVAPDLRGMGLSDAPDLGYNMATYASDLAALLDALGINEVVLAGLSMGGYVAFEFVRRWRDRVRGLVLIDTRAEADSPEGRHNRDAAATEARDRGPVSVVEAMLDKLLAPDVAPALRERTRAMILDTPVAGIVGALAAMRDRPDSTPLLPELAGIPTLVVVGAEDSIIPPRQAQMMAEMIPGARLAVIPGAGHIPPLEQPKRTTEILREFLTAVRGEK